MTEPEKEILSRDAGKEIAERFREDASTNSIDKAVKTALDKIPFTLLSDKHIKQVVVATGAISPFFEGGKSRLKKSAYEGRIGSKAYIFGDDSAPIKCYDSSKETFLLIPKNSIVFVECDLDFRLPDFIAARFNLQIRHVHRGLLLGTGPLVDPGFRGKLGIPIHNLTDEDYKIPSDEGLIWLEFTKTTADIGGDKSGADPLGGKEFWDISKYLVKASRQFGLDPDRPSVPIRSSLPTMFDKANSSAKAAEIAAKASKKYSRNAAIINFISAFSAAVAIAALIATFIFSVRDTQKVLSDLGPRLSEVEQKFDNHGKAVSASLQTDQESQTALEKLLAQARDTDVTTQDIVRQLQNQISVNKTLQSTVAKLEGDLGQLAEEIRTLRATEEATPEN